MQAHARGIVMCQLSSRNFFDRHASPRHVDLMPLPRNGARVLVIYSISPPVKVLTSTD